MHRVKSHPVLQFKDNKLTSEMRVFEGVFQIWGNAKGLFCHGLGGIQLATGTDLSCSNLFLWLHTYGQRNCHWALKENSFHSLIFLTVYNFFACTRTGKKTATGLHWRKRQSRFNLGSFLQFSISFATHAHGMHTERNYVRKVKPPYINFLLFRLTVYSLNGHWCQEQTPFGIIPFRRHFSYMYPTIEMFNWNRCRLSHDARRNIFHKKKFVKLLLSQNLQMVVVASGACI